MVRGRVVTRAGRGVVGFRVSTSENLEGFTLTRRDGWFDMMVNGGGAVTLSFGKPPFSHKTVRNFFHLLRKYLLIFESYSLCGRFYFLFEKLKIAK